MLVEASAAEMLGYRIDHQTRKPNLANFELVDRGDRIARSTEPKPDYKKRRIGGSGKGYTIVNRKHRRRIDQNIVKLRIELLAEVAQAKTEQVVGDVLNPWTAGH